MNVISRVQGSKTRPSFANSPLVDVSAPCSSCTPELPNFTSKTKEKVKIRPRTTNQESSVRPLYQYGETILMLYGNQSALSPFLLRQHTCDYSSWANLLMRSFPLWDSSDPCQC